MTLSEIYALLNKGEYKIAAEEVKKINLLYRKGESPITDPEYDKLIDTFKFLDPENEIFQSGVIEDVDEVDSERKEKLKYPMFSLDKETSIEEIAKWLKNKSVPSNAQLVITAKYDGISILKDENLQLAWSRGDGIFGETMHEHYKRLNDKAPKNSIYTIGEMIIPKPVFASHTFYRDNGEPFKNARNMIAGLKNSDTISDDLQYAKHVRYGLADDDFMKDKSEQLDFICKNLHEIPYKIVSADKLNIEELNDLFVEWGNEFDIDGLVIDINDKNIRKQLGRERNNNPAYARAFKNPEWSQVNEVPCRGIEWNVSKTKAIKPVVLLEPFDVEGVTISRATGYNAKFILENNIGEGSVLQVIRSGGVIPKIIGVIKSGNLSLPKVCPSCGSTLEWNENEVELICNNKSCGEIKFQKLAFFFVRFKITGFAEKTIQKFFDAGYDTVGKILSMTSTEIQTLDGMGNLSASKLLKEFDEKIKNVPFEIIGHASGCFENIGSRKLKMIFDGIKDIPYNNSMLYVGGFNYFKTAMENMDLTEVVNILKNKDFYNEAINKLNTINGMSTKTSENFLNGLVCFNEFISDLNINITDEIKVSEDLVNDIDDNSGMEKIDMTGRVFVFTGFRDSDLKNFIESCGGSVKDAITKATTDLLTKNEDSTSSKAVKAKKMGARVIQVDNFKNSLK